MNARRLFIATALALTGVSRRVWAQVAGPATAARYAELTHPVRIAAAQVSTPWRPVPFVAEAVAPAFAARGSGPPAARRVLISGVVFRTEARLSALCVTCPHEQCHVDLVTDPARLARISGQKATHPVFECGCHFSVFDAANEGARLSGETPRGLYRFRVTDIGDGMVHITHIEEVALVEV